MCQNKNQAAMKRLFLFVTEGEGKEFKISQSVEIEFLHPVKGYPDIVETISILKDSVEEIFQHEIEVNVNLPENSNIESLKQMELNTL